MMNGYNDNITDQQLAKLQELFPEAFTEGKLSLPQLRATLGDAIDGGDSYGLSWKGKSGVFAKIQEKTVETLRPDRDNSVDWDTTGNMFIEGDNLAALKILHKSYYGRVKMIYIDPPYNTGNDFVYNDDFKQTRKSYEAEAGIVDDEGNITRDDGLRANTGGHKHSNWLNMMYPRLFLARNLLRQDGVIFVSIDDNEVHNLRLMMNEIFGEENFVAQIVVQTNPRGRSLDRHIAKTFEYILVYTRRYEENGIYQVAKTDKALSEYKNEDERGQYRLLELRNRNPVFDRTNRPNLYFPIFINPATNEVSTEKRDDFTETALPMNSENKEGCWTWSRDKVSNNSSQLTAKRVSTGVWRVFRKDYIPEDGATTKEKSLWLDSNLNHENGKELVRKLFGDTLFDFPKSTDLIKRTLAMASRDDDIILDFFSGSGTTAHAVAELNAEDGGNRQWICVQLPEQTSEKSEAFKAGYTNIADIARERIRRAGAKIRTDFADKLAEREMPLDLGFRAYRVSDSNFKPWNELLADPEEIRQQMLDAIDPIEPDATDESILTELLLKCGISPLTDIEDRDAYLFVPSANLAIRLAPDLTEPEFGEILASGAQTILILSCALGTNETLRMNLTLQAEQQGVKVEVV